MYNNVSYWGGSYWGNSYWANSYWTIILLINIIPNVPFCRVRFILKENRMSHIKDI